jgi:prepilin-type N-terminal cleavage/methylation domain-containing protein
MKLELISRPAKSASGFSLVELLVCIGVLGVLAAISIVVLNPVRENARVNKDKRNAQAIAAVAGSAQAAGAVLNTASVNEVIAQLRSGVSGSGLFSSSEFKVAPFTPEEISAISPYLQITGNAVVYNQPR